MPHIRPVAAHDLPALKHLITALAELHGDTARVTEDSLQRDLLGEAPWVLGLVAEYDFALVAYAALCPRAQLQFGERGLDIHHLYVRPAWRGQGLGRRMIEACVQKATTLHCDYVITSTAPDNKAAQGAYRACGFVQLADPTRFRRAIR
ncbi:GNAT family N-acetyltransferase [Falsirhodobacter sp. 20TX0035]|uniref:GNAT family N-acetyltransferase n=1 Tax=Falsirhodobacter sp. 20TX0035 TaxID=3022019 RepID=UPI00232FD560|nr:GNAT family N-acetyltransferase [Falsirhodobacter sp. 20TX0035]MDB6452233.1 GNAT family N-acetyltransferase [Falsirhodobacter sp. 20TX0035]